uniref:5-hydroxytryptamine receptor 1A-beta-like n=1 Tax=Pristiophorus japonicus TaxID=55135 RepID=UPI00398E3F72
MPGPLGPGSNGSSSPVYIPLSAVSLAVSGLMLGCTLVIGVLGNGLVCRVVYANKSLQTANNALLVNLAASDLLRCTVDIPGFLVATTWGNSRADLGESMCLLQPFTYSLSSCVQLVTLVVISAERYQAVAHPFQTAKRRVRVKVWISMVWSAGLVLSVFSVTVAKDTPVYLRCRHRPIDAQSYFDPFGSYILLPVWMASLSLIIVHYTRIFVLVRRHSNRIFDSGIVPASPEEHGLRLPASAWHSVQQMPAAMVPTNGQVQHLHIEADPALQSKKDVCPVQCQVAPMNNSVLSPPGHGPSDAPNIVGAVCLVTSKSREHTTKRMEGKLAKRFGYIILTFLVFWMPLVIILLLNTFLQGAFSMRPLLLELQTFAVALTCVPAAVNPFIYTMLNQQFHSEIQQVITRLRSTCHTPFLKGHAPCLKGRAPCLMGHAPCLMGHTPCLKGHAPCLKGHAPCLMGHAPCLMGHAPCLMGHAPCLIGHAPCLIGHAPCLIGHAPCLKGHALYLKGHAPYLRHPRGDVIERATKMVAKMELDHLLYQRALLQIGGK